MRGIGRAAAVLLAVGAVTVAAVSARAGTDARLPDGLPAGVSIPPGAGSQAFEFGDCLSREHAEGGWVCTEDDETTAAYAQQRARAGAAQDAQDGAYSRYHFNHPRMTAWGFGRVVYGTIWWERAGNFNGSQSQFWQAGTVVSGAHTVRYDFRNEVYRRTVSGWEYRDVQRNIVPDYPNCTRQRARMPTWYHPHVRGHDYHQDMWFKLRDCIVRNPSTEDGTWYSPRFSSRIYRCVDRRGSCYFRNPD